MFVEVRYKVAEDSERIKMYNDMEKREAAGQKVVALAPFELGKYMLGRIVVEVMFVVYRS